MIGTTNKHRHPQSKRLNALSLQVTLNAQAFINMYKKKEVGSETPRIACHQYFIQRKHGMLRTYQKSLSILTHQIEWQLLSIIIQKNPYNISKEPPALKKSPALKKWVASLSGRRPSLGKWDHLNAITSRWCYLTPRLHLQGCRGFLIKPLPRFIPAPIPNISETTTFS